MNAARFLRFASYNPTPLGRAMRPLYFTKAERDAMDDVLRRVRKKEASYDKVVKRTMVRRKQKIATQQAEIFANEKANVSRETKKLARLARRKGHSARRQTAVLKQERVLVNKSLTIQTNNKTKKESREREKRLKKAEEARKKAYEALLKKRKTKRASIRAEKAKIKAKQKIKLDENQRINKESGPVSPRTLYTKLQTGKGLSMKEISDNFRALNASEKQTLADQAKKNLARRNDLKNCRKKKPTEFALFLKTNMPGYLADARKQTDDHKLAFSTAIRAVAALFKERKK